MIEGSMLKDDAYVCLVQCADSESGLYHIVLYGLSLRLILPRPLMQIFPLAAPVVLHCPAAECDSNVRFKPECMDVARERR